MAQKYNLTLEEVIEINNSEDGVIHYDANKNKYIIAYNDTIPLEERVYWTLAHEFGHYLLEHHKESGKSNLARYELTESEYKVFEVEANFFTRFFVSPPPIITEVNMDNPSRVSSFFGISFSAAMSTLSYIKNSINRGFQFVIPKFLLNNFNNVIIKGKYGRTCLNCNVFFYIKNSNFCPICGSNQIFNAYKGDDVKMKYPGYLLNELGRVLTCPRCDNEDIKGKYCNVCNTYLFNKCSGLKDDDDGYFQNRGNILWHSFNEGCGELLDGNARYCHECGSTSVFYEEGLLGHWSSVKDKIENNSITLTEEELPF